MAKYKTDRGGLYYVWGERIIKDAIIRDGLIDPESSIIIFKEAHAELMEILEKAAIEISRNAGKLMRERLGKMVTRRDILNGALLYFSNPEDRQGNNTGQENHNNPEPHR